jgi:cyclophilin family peptidyl-prolyl cis-trans isomerase/HEAT repeat protein
VNRFYPLLLIGLFALAGCNAQREKKGPNKFSDSVYVRIADLQDRRLGDSLQVYLHADNADYREQALLALGSVQDSLQVPVIGTLLHDEQVSVRFAAAFALGQTRGGASERLLAKALQTEKDPRVRARIYESYGRTARRWNIDETVPSDSIEAAGFAWSLFRTAGDSMLNPLAAQLLKNPATTVRLAAAHYFARKAPNPQLEEQPLVYVAQHDRSDEVRMAAALALRKIPGDNVLDALQNILVKEPSYRVRVNAVSALQSFPARRVRPILLKSLQDKSLPVAIRAAEVINAQPSDSAWTDFSTSARKASNFRVKALLYQAAMRASQDQDIYKEIRNIYSHSTDAYHKAAYLGALGKTLMAFAFVRDELTHADTAAVRTAAALALTEMNRSKTFVDALRPDFIDAYRAAIALGDLGVTSVVCEALSDPELGYKPLIKDWQFLYDAKNRLKLPADNETLQAVESAIAYFEGKTPSPVHNSFNHPIDWPIVRSINADQRALIVTSKGVVSLRLLVEEAPGSVANFVSLVRSGVYNGKYFHRVVPNFVAQGGCPRGDGYGSESYSIRSEFSTRRYKTGSVGLASAGKDTESSQWFITHSPTPHLDGAYTIFAEVEDGMDIVHQLEVGDKILKIELPGDVF